MSVEHNGQGRIAGMPLIGDRFPDLEVQTTHGPLRLPQAFEGRWFVLFSHPADFTPVCTTEFVAFQKRYEEFKKLNTELIGLSVDQIYAHIAWVRWIKEKLGVEIQFPIIAGTEELAKRLGMIHPGAGSDTVRAVFLVDPKATVRAILYYPQELGRNLDEILRMIRGFRLSDEKNVAIPANWPQNELLGEKVILKPPKDVKAAEERVQTCEGKGYDWWFCYTDVSH